jgi:hypothetical protein
MKQATTPTPHHTNTNTNTAVSDQQHTPLKLGIKSASPNRKQEEAGKCLSEAAWPEHGPDAGTTGLHCVNWTHANNVQPQFNCSCCHSWGTSHSKSNTHAHTDSPQQLSKRTHASSLALNWHGTHAAAAAAASPTPSNQQKRSSHAQRRAYKPCCEKDAIIQRLRACCPALTFGEHMAMHTGIRCGTQKPLTCACCGGLLSSAPPL